MAKIPSKRVPSDDCIVRVGRKIADEKIVEEGIAYNIHEGEWIEVIPVRSLRQYFALSRLIAGGDAQKMESSLDDLCEQVAERVTAWNWTDMGGNPLPQPYKNPDAIKTLTEDELLYLMSAVQGETPGQRKNASAPLPTN